MSDYKITSDFFYEHEQDTHVPCIRAVYPDNTFTQLSHRGPIAFPLPFFTVLMNDDEHAYILRSELLQLHGYHHTGKWHGSMRENKKAYEIWEHFTWSGTRRLPGRNKSAYIIGAVIATLYVDGKEIFQLSCYGEVRMRKDLTRHDRNCLKTYCKLYGNDMTYDLLMSYHKKHEYIFNIIDILCDKKEEN